MIPDAHSEGRHVRHHPRAKRLAIIGNGMATCRLLDELTRRGAEERYAITVFGEEPCGAYNRILLSKVLGGAPPDDIVTKPLSWYERHRIRLVSGAPVRKMDAARKSLATAQGDEFRFDVAVLATGSRPTVPPIEGMTKEGGELRDGVFVYRTMDDCLKMRRFARPGDTAVVLGAGLLGLEAAKVLCDLGLHVTVVHVGQTVLNAQLDAHGGEMLRRRIERLGIFVRTGHTVEQIAGETAVEAVVLDDGRTLPADMVVLACGVRPRVELATASGLPINRGIVVNDVLATEAPGVYALGECAEHRGQTYGLVAPAWEQAAVLADVLTGTNPGARYEGTTPFSRLKVAGVDVASMGRIEPELETDSVLQVVEDRRSVYRKLVLREGRLIGAMLVGDTTAAASLVQSLDRRDPLPTDPLEALCTSPPPAAAAERLVCTCHKVTDACILQSVAAGAHSVEAVGAATAAGTGCGSCRTEIARLVARRTGSPSLPVVANAVASVAANGVS